MTVSTTGIRDPSIVTEEWTHNIFLMADWHISVKMYMVGIQQAKVPTAPQ